MHHQRFAAIDKESPRAKLRCAQMIEGGKYEVEEWFANSTEMLALEPIPAALFPWSALFHLSQDAEI